MLLFLGCEKENIEFKGEVIRGVNDCTTPEGFPYIIKYINTNNFADSLIIASLPSAYKLPGTKILFKIRTRISSGEEMICDGLFITVIQKSIYEVKVR